MLEEGDEQRLCKCRELVQCGRYEKKRRQLPQAVQRVGGNTLSLSPLFLPCSVLLFQLTLSSRRSCRSATNFKKGIDQSIDLPPRRVSVNVCKEECVFLFLPLPLPALPPSGCPAPEAVGLTRTFPLPSSY